MNRIQDIEETREFDQPFEETYFIDETRRNASVDWARSFGYRVQWRIGAALDDQQVDTDDFGLLQYRFLTENVTEMAQGLAGATMALSAMLQQMSDTTGSIGKLLADSTIHDDVHGLLVSLRELLDDIRERPGRYTFVSVF